MADENHVGHNHDHNHGNTDGMCNGGCCGCGCGWKGRRGWFMALRWFLAVIVLLGVFSLGMRIGELKGQLEAGGGFGYHTRGGMMPQQQGAYFGQ